MNLSTPYLGKVLRTPLVASASPLSRRVSDVRALEDAGISAVVLFSLFEEQLTLTTPDLHRFLAQGGTYAQTLASMRASDRLGLSPLDYLEHIHRTKSAVDIPVIASLNGAPRLRWTHYARLVQQAGADALEINLYAVPTDLERSGADVEASYLATVATVREEVDIPVAVKLSPYFTSMTHMARGFERAGADALVLFNRFYQPDLDLERMDVKPKLSLSTSNDHRLPLRWIGILRNKLKLQLAATTGIHDADDVIKMLLAGADVTMLCATLLEHGLGRVKTIEDGLRAWMVANEHNRIADFKGMLSQGSANSAGAFERAQYIKTLESYDPSDPVTIPRRGSV